MALPSGALIKVTLNGAIGADVWSTGFWTTVIAPVTPTGAALNTWAESVRALFASTVWTASVGGLNGQNTSAVSFANAKAYWYLDGALVQQGVSSGSALVGTSTTAHPAYTACACTLQTGLAGRSNRGRMYLPATGTTITAATLQFAAAAAQNSTNLATFLSAVNGTAIGGSTPVVAVVSQAHLATHKVTAVRADSIPDTQRGRQNKVTAISTSSVALSA